MIGLRKLLKPTDEPTANYDQPAENERTEDRTARYMAEQICSGFQLHDRRQRTEAEEAFGAVDRRQFRNLDADEADAAAAAYVDALWEKDAVEKRHLQNGAIDAKSIADADWGSVLEALERRAHIAGIDREYAVQTTEAWRRHKTGEDYWTPFLRAQSAELAAATGVENFPEKPKEGRSGFGPIATRYVLAVEHHDMHTREHWEEAIRVMVPYYRAVLDAHQKDVSDD